jgi:hypothetical protein
MADDNTGAFVWAGVGGLAVGILGVTLYQRAQSAQVAAPGTTNTPLMGLAELAFVVGLGVTGLGIYEKTMWMQALGVLGVAAGGIPLILAFDGVSNGPISQLTAGPSVAPSPTDGTLPEGAPVS